MARSKAKGGKPARKRRTRTPSGTRRGVRAGAVRELGSLAPESSTLLVDIHCHVFSGRDIPLKEFLHYGRGIPWGIAYLVDWLITHPSSATPADKERAKLVAVSEGGAKQSDFQEAEDRGLLERFFAYSDLMRRPVRAIAESMVNTYPGVQLFTPAMVDMDCWLGDASFYDQRLQDHAQLALLKDQDRRGRLHHRGVEGPRHLEGQGALRPEGHAGRHGGVEGRAGAGEDHLAREQRRPAHAASSPDSPDVEER